MPSSDSFLVNRLITFGYQVFIIFSSAFLACIDKSFFSDPQSIGPLPLFMKKNDLKQTIDIGHDTKLLKQDKLKLFLT